MSIRAIIYFLLISFTSFKFQTTNPDNFVKLNNGEIEIFIDNVGNIITDSLSNSLDQTLYDNLNIYNAGFYISGKANQKLKFSRNFKLIRGNNHFKPGGIFVDHAEQTMFSITNSNKPFIDSWINWKLAVEMGADYYDGNMNGIYDPIDINKNSLWDENEDRPPNVGYDFSWCIYNDLTDRTGDNLQSEPLGIEIQQTSFINSKLLNSNLDRIVFVKYSLKNTGVFSNRLDSCYFSVAADLDAGENYNLDLMGCDTLKSNAFIFQSYRDSVLKRQQSVFAFVKILSPAFSTDTSNIVPSNLIVNQGFLGSDTIHSSQIANLSSIYDRRTGFWPLNENALTLRNVQVFGAYEHHTLLDPCSTDTTLSNIKGITCEMIDPKFMFSGNPISKFGWTSNWVSDHSVYISHGPFKLEKDKPIDVWVCYSSVKGDSLEDAYNKMLEIDNYAQTFYNYNFFIEPPTPSINNIDLNDYDFYLWNNYPNPFNNSTKIKYNLDRTGFTTLKVFNSLGQEITTLVSETQDKGVYEIDFKADNLSSGIYFYQLRQNAFYWAREMVYLK